MRYIKQLLQAIGSLCAPPLTALRDRVVEGTPTRRVAETTASLFLSTEEGEGASVHDTQGIIFDRMVEVSLEGLSLTGDIDVTTISERDVCDADKQGSSRCLDAICIALEQDQTHEWYVSTMDLQQVSFQFCVACRSFRSFCITVDEHMPLSLWGCDYSMDEPSQVTDNRGVPSLRASRVLCRMHKSITVQSKPDSTIVNWSNFSKMEFYEGVYQCYISFQELEDSCLMLWQQLLTSEILSPLRFLGAMEFSFSIPHQDSIRGARSSKQIDVMRLARLDKHWSMVQREQDRWMDDFDHQHSLVTFPHMIRYFTLDWDALVDRGRVTSLAQLDVAMSCVNRRHFSSRMVMPFSLRELTFESEFNQPIVGIVWPSSLRKLSFGWRFDQPIRRVVWPSSLRSLTFGYEFNRPVVGIVWPPLIELEFGGCFTHQIEDCVLPSSLLRLSFGGGFDHPIHRVVWPTSLQSLELGFQFNQPVEGIVWPSCLRSLLMGDTFNQPIGTVKWPDTLEHLVFGETFCQPVNRVVWPASLRQLEFGCKFSHSIEGTIWPGALQKLTAGGSVKGPFGLGALPASLRELTFADNFNQPIAHEVMPANLETMCLGHKFDHPIDGVMWPDSLVTIALSGCFNQPIDKVAWPIRLRKLTFGCLFNQPIESVIWPSSLEQIEFGACFEQNVQRVVWPIFIKELIFGERFNEPLGGLVWPTTLEKLYVPNSLDEPFR